MDVSSYFKACVKTVVLCNKAIETPSDVNTVSNIRLKQSLFVSKAQKVANQIYKLYELLTTNRSAYSNVCSYAPNKAYTTDIDREEIDLIAQNIICTCSKLIKELKRETAASNVSQQYQEHCEIVAILIEEDLKQVCKIYSELKAIRVKKSIELRKSSKIEPTLVQKETTFQNDSNKLSASTNSTLNKDDNNAYSLKVQEINGDIGGALHHEVQQLSPEDIQIFEDENKQLHDELNALTEEIQSKVVRITELQDLLTEQVLDQDKNLDRVITTVVGSTENVREANEQIRKAIQRNAGLRVWVLFFLLVMAFTLLFLDWYNV